MSRRPKWWRTGSSLSRTATASRAHSRELEYSRSGPHHTKVSSPGLTGRSSNHRPWILDCPVKPGNDTLPREDSVQGLGCAMKFACFHLMPYRPLDFEERAKHRSAWVVLPNSLYDPKKGA